LQAFLPLELLTSLFLWRVFFFFFLKTGSPEELYAQGWLQILIFLISASRVARIISMSHPAPSQKRHS
jgi:hypothetical protein